MAKKTKPCWGWTGAGEYPVEPFSDEGFKLLAPLLNREGLSPIIKSELTEIAQSYHMNKSYFSSKPRPGMIKVGLEEVKEKSKALIDCLEKIDRDTYEKLAVASPNAELFDILDGQTDVHRIYSAAKKALENIKPDPGGRPRDYGLKDCINALAHLFEKITEKKAGLTKSAYNEESPFQGPFFVFVQSFLKLIDESEFYSNIAIGKQIEKTLKLRKTSVQ